MKKTFLIICACIFILSGCSYIIEITHDNTSTPPTYYLKEKHIVFGKLPSVREVSFYKVVDNSPVYSDPIWSIKADGVKIKQLTYGVLPEGFKIVSPAKKLLPETKYHVFVSAWGSSGFMEFQIIGGT